MTTNNLKGVSPVIATILMVMITVGLVAFSYTWFMSMGSAAQTQSEDQLSKMQRAQQSFEVPTAIICGDSDAICFEFMASALNTFNYPANQTFISCYIEGLPKVLNTWNSGVGGPCYDNDTQLTPGSSCYGNITISSCTTGEILSFKIKHDWGAEKTVSVLCK